MSLPLPRLTPSATAARLKPTVSMREALTDPQLLGGALPGESWRLWRVLLIAAMGEALDDEERALFAEVTGREREPLELVEELWAIVGRRSGKTRAAGTLAAYVGALCDHSDVLAPGERGVIPILAASVSQAGRAFMHAMGVLEHSPVLGQMVEPSTAEVIRLSTGIDIEVRPANFRTIRSVTAVAAIADEIAFWLIESASNPDDEILTALRPALATTGGPLMVISSPYAKRGELYKTYRRDYGARGDPLILVAKGPSRTFNPTLQQRLVDRAYERDAAAAAAEYGGEFRSDIAALLTREVVEAVTMTGRYELPPIQGERYQAFVDPSGGSADSFTLAIAHRRGTDAILDAVRERRPPFSPEAVVQEFADLLKTYGIASVRGDHYAGDWPRERFRAHGIRYELADLTASAYYGELLPLLNSGRVELLDHQRLSAQLIALERRTSRTGKDLISHPPQGHDDLANAAAGVLCLAARGLRKMAISDATVARSARPSPQAFVHSYHRGL